MRLKNCNGFDVFAFFKVLMLNCLIGLTYLSYLSNLLQITYHINKKFLLRERSSIKGSILFPDIMSVVGNLVFVKKNILTFD